MKKLILVLSMIMTLLCGSMSFATNDEADNIAKSTLDDVKFEDTTLDEKEEENDETQTSATTKILNNKSKKDRKIAEYMDKYNNETYAYTAYILEVIQLYSLPICIIGLTWGAFNFYIIGGKKLDKREQGFGYIVAFLCGLVVFQVLPLVFALLVAGK